MQSFLQLLHVLSVVLVVGPLALVPFGGLRGIRRRDADEVRVAATRTAWFGVGSLAVALLGAAATADSSRYSFRTPWVIISITLYVIALILVFVWALPALRKAAGMVDVGVLDQPAGTPADEPDPVVTTSGVSLAGKAQLDAITGRVGAAAGVNLLLLAVITTLMVLRPFGS
jgi:uncharacterized membrane protein